MPHYLLSVHTVAGQAPKKRTDDEMRRSGERLGAREDEMKTTGAWLFSGRLSEPDAATVVRTSSGKVLTTDGPFAESREHLGGFYVIEAEDLDAALGWASRVTDAIDVPIEVRPFVALAT